MKATRIYYRKEALSNGNIIEMVIWKIPISAECPHGLKYRLHYGSSQGVCFVRYDSEKGKGDHKHIGSREEAYHFKSVEKLVRDFLADVAEHRKRQKR